MEADVHLFVTIGISFIVTSQVYWCKSGREISFCASSINLLLLGKQLKRGVGREKEKQRRGIKRYLLINHKTQQVCIWNQTCWYKEWRCFGMSSRYLLYMRLDTCRHTFHRLLLSCPTVPSHHVPHVSSIKLWWLTEEAFFTLWESDECP